MGSTLWNSLRVWFFSWWPFAWANTLWQERCEHEQLWSDFDSLVKDLETARNELATKAEGPEESE